MKKIIDRIISFILILSFLVSLMSFAVFAKDGEEDYQGNITYRGAYYYRPGLGDFEAIPESMDYYVYSDDYFINSSKEYNPNLATLSMALAEASSNTSRETSAEGGYENKGLNAVAFVEDIGFTDIEINEAYTNKPGKDSVGVLSAHKKIRDNNKEYTLLTVFPRSAGYGAEWGNNFELGKNGDAQGFDDCADICLDFAKEYINTHNISGDIKFWTVGYSRGAAIANLIAHKLVDDPSFYLGDNVILDSENLFAYTFATPKAAYTGNDIRNEKYSGIFNSYCNTELLSAFAPSAMEFGRYGTDRMIIDKNRVADMEAMLQICSPETFDIYDKGSKSSNFIPKKLNVTDSDSIVTVDDNDSYIPDDISVYLQGLCSYLTVITGGRKNYSQEFEPALSDLLAYFGSLENGELSAFIGELTDNEDSLLLVTSLYAYFMKTKNTGVKLNYQEAAGISKEIVALTGYDESLDDTGINASIIAKISKELVKYMLMSPEKIKARAAGYLGNVLGDAMKRSGATDEEMAALLNDNALLPLVHFSSHLFFGNIWQSDDVSPLTFNNEQIKNAATLIGNSENYILVVDHMNEIVKSWVKIDDSNYDDYASLTDAQIKGYRRVYVDAEKRDIVDGVIVDKDNNVVGKIENGVLVSNKDKWVGFTTTDEGGFFRIPTDREYRIILHSESENEINIKIGEYNCYEAKTYMKYGNSVLLNEDNEAVVLLPGLDSGDYVIPSNAEYTVSIREKDEYMIGDTDNDLSITIIDATVIQEYLALSVKFDDIQIILADVDNDGSISIIDVTWIQRYLARLDCPKSIGTIIKL